MRQLADETRQQELDRVQEMYPDLGSEQRHQAADRMTKQRMLYIGNKLITLNPLRVPGTNTLENPLFRLGTL